jgi:hypothetical protein
MSVFAPAYTRIIFAKQFLMWMAAASVQENSLWSYRDEMFGWRWSLLSLCARNALRLRRKLSSSVIQCVVFVFMRRRPSRNCRIKVTEMKASHVCRWFEFCVLCKTFFASIDIRDVVSVRPYASFPEPPEGFRFKFGVKILQPEATHNSYFLCCNRQ